MRYSGDLLEDQIENPLVVYDLVCHLYGIDLVDHLPNG